MSQLHKAKKKNTSIPMLDRSHFTFLWLLACDKKRKIIFYQDDNKRTLLLQWTVKSTNKLSCTSKQAMNKLFDSIIVKTLWKPSQIWALNSKLWVEKWIWSGFILTSVAVKYYRQLFSVAAFVIVFQFYVHLYPFFFFRSWAYGMTVKNTHSMSKWVTL